MELLSLDGLQRNVLYSLDYENYYYMKKDENKEDESNLNTSQESNISENNTENTTDGNTTEN